MIPQSETILERERPSVGRTWARLRRNAFVRAVVPIEARFTPPIPIVEGSEVFLRGFAYGTSKRPGEPAEVFRPRISFIITFPSERCVSFEDLSFRAQFPQVPFTTPLDSFPHPAIAKWTILEYRRAEDRLLELTDQLITSLGGRVALDAVWDEASDLWSLLLPPALLSFVRPFAHDFFAHLNLRQ